MAPFKEADVKIESGRDLINTFVFTDTESGQPKDKTFCKTCGVTLWTITAASREKGEILVRMSLLDTG